MKIKGEVTYTDETGKIHQIEGKIVLPDDTAFQKLKVDGKFSFENISCEKISVDGKCEGGTLNAKNLSVDGKIKADTVKVEQLFEVDGKAKIDELEADEIIIESHSGSLGEVKCRKIKIFSNSNENDESAKVAITSKLFGVEISASDENQRVRIRKIDAQKVDLQNCEVDVIRCTDAKIGENCAVERLIVSGEYEIAADSKVGEIIKEDSK